MKKTYCKEVYSFETLSEIINAIWNGKKVTYPTRNEYDYEYNNIYNEYEIFIYNNNVVTYELHANLNGIPEEVFNLTVDECENYFRENYDDLDEKVRDNIDTLLYFLRYSNVVIENGVQIIDEYDVEKRKKEVDKYYKNYEEFAKVNS